MTLVVTFPWCDSKLSLLLSLFSVPVQSAASQLKAGCLVALMLTLSLFFCWSIALEEWKKEEKRRRRRRVPVIIKHEYLAHKTRSRSHQSIHQWPFLPLLISLSSLFYDIFFLCLIFLFLSPCTRRKEERFHFSISLACNCVKCHSMPIRARCKGKWVSF